MKSTFFSSFVASVAFLVLLVPAGRRAAAQNPDSAAVNKLLQAVNIHAADADYDAGKLSTFTRSAVGRDAYGMKLNQIKEHVNNLIADSNELNAMRSEGSPWQQEAVGQIVQLLPEMADHLNTTINYLNEHPRHTKFKPFRDYVFANEKLIHNAHEIISGYVSYGEAKSKSEALEKDLKVPVPVAPGT